MDPSRLKKKKFDVRKHIKEPAFRELVFLRDKIDVEKRTIEVAWASETPYERWWGIEVLDCSPGAIRLGRLQNKAAVLFNHDRDCLIGVVESVTVGGDRIPRSVLRFGKGAEADKHFQDAIDGILTKVSVGYAIHTMVLEKEDEGIPTYRITDWEPHEISMVTIPADDTVGLGRSADDEDKSTDEDDEAKSDDEDKTDDESKTDDDDKSTDEDDESKTDGEDDDKSDDEDDSDKSDDSEKHLIISVTEHKQMDETKRRDELIALGSRYSEYITTKDVQEATTKGWTPSQLQDLVIERQKTKHINTGGGHIGLSRSEVQGYSIGRAIAAALTGNWEKAGLERAASEAASQMLKSAHGGMTFSIPFDILAAARDFTVGTPSEAGNLVATDLRGDLFTDVLRNQLALSGLGATQLFGLTSSIDIPRKTVGAALGFVAETAAAAETQINTGKVSLTPKRITGYVEYSKQAVIQSALAVEPMLRQDLISELAVQSEFSAINGSGAGSNPRGLRQTSGIGSVIGGANGAQINWGHIVGLETAVANVNAEPDVNSGYLVNTKLRGWAKQTQKAPNLPFIWDNGDQPLNGYRAAVTNNVPSNLTKGTSAGVASSVIYSSSWDMLVMAWFGAIEVTVDEVTLATTGLNRLILNAFFDVGNRRPANFSVMDDALTA